MANIEGTNIAAPVVPFSITDKFPSHEAIYGKGGWRTVVNLSERDSIPEPRRENLMIVAVENNSTSGTTGGTMVYQLALGTVDNDLTNNDNWIELELGGSGGDDWILPPPITTFSAGIPGQRSYDEDFIYICILPDTWKRINMDYFSVTLGTSGTSFQQLDLNFGDVPVFNGSNWDFDPIIRDVSGTTGLINVHYTDNTIKTIDLFGTNSDLVQPQIMTPDDKFLTGLETITDGDLATNDTISNTPVDGCYVSVFINGQEFEVGNGVTTKAAYFSDDGGTTAKNFSSTGPNGQITTGDNIYWNGSVAGTQLQAGWRISLLYLT